MNHTFDEVAVYTRIKPGGPLSYGDTCFLNASDEKVLQFCRTGWKPRDDRSAWQSCKVRYNFHQQCTQEEIWNWFNTDLVNKHLNTSYGSLTVFMCGHAGAGKTWTCDGDFDMEDCQRLLNGSMRIPRVIDENMGLIPRIFNKYSELNVPVQMAYVNIGYCSAEPVKGMVWDLVRNEPILGLKFVELSLQSDGLQNTYVAPDSAWNTMISYDEMMRTWLKGKVAYEELDADRRGHTLLMITTDCSLTHNTLKDHVLTIVDLAGTTRQGCSPKDQFTKSSVSALETLLTELGSKNRGSFINFHANKLTQILQNTVSTANVRWAFFMALTSILTEQEDTISTLDFASRLKILKAPPPWMTSVGLHLADKGCQAGTDSWYRHQKVYAKLGTVTKMCFFKKCDSYNSLLQKFSFKFKARIGISFADLSGAMIDIDDDETLRFALDEAKEHDLHLVCRHVDETTYDQGHSINLQRILDYTLDIVFRLIHLSRHAKSASRLLKLYESIKDQNFTSLDAITWHLDNAVRIWHTTPATKGAKDDEGTAYDEYDPLGSDPRNALGHDSWLNNSDAPNKLVPVLQKVVGLAVLGSSVVGMSKQVCEMLMDHCGFKVLDLLQHYRLEADVRSAKQVFEHVASTGLIPVSQVLSTVPNLSGPDAFAGCIETYITSYNLEQKNPNKLSLSDIFKHMSVKATEMIDIVNIACHHEGIRVTKEGVLNLIKNYNTEEACGLISDLMADWKLSGFDVLNLDKTIDRRGVLSVIWSLISEHDFRPVEVFPGLTTSVHFSSMESISDAIRNKVEIVDVDSIADTLLFYQQSKAMDPSDAICAGYLMGAVVILHKTSLLDVKHSLEARLEDVKYLEHLLMTFSNNSFTFALLQKSSTATLAEGKKPRQSLYRTNLEPATPGTMNRRSSETSSAVDNDSIYSDMKFEEKKAEDVVGIVGLRLARSALEATRFTASLNYTVQEVLQIIQATPLNLKELTDICCAAASRCAAHDPNQRSAIVRTLLQEVLTQRQLTPEQLHQLVIKFSNRLFKMETVYTTGEEMLSSATNKMIQLFFGMTDNFLGLLHLLPHSPALDRFHSPKVLELARSLMEWANITLGKLPPLMGPFITKAIPKVEDETLLETGYKPTPTTFESIDQVVQWIPLTKGQRIVIIQEWIVRANIKAIDIFDCDNFDKWKDLLHSSTFFKDAAGQESIVRAMSNCELVQTEANKLSLRLIHGLGTSVLDVMHHWIATSQVSEFETKLANMCLEIPWRLNTVIGIVRHCCNKYRCTPLDVFNASSIMKVVHQIGKEGRLSMQDLIVLARMSSMADFVKLVKVFITVYNMSLDASKDSRSNEAASPGATPRSGQSVPSSSPWFKSTVPEITLYDVVKMLAEELGRFQMDALCRQLTKMSALSGEGDTNSADGMSPERKGAPDPIDEAVGHLSVLSISKVLNNRNKIRRKKSTIESSPRDHTSREPTSREPTPGTPGTPGISAGPSFSTASSPTAGATSSSRRLSSAIVTSAPPRRNPIKSRTSPALMSGVSLASSPAGPALNHQGLGSSFPS